MADIGFMQGRLSPMVNGQVQAFPWTHWWKEFEIARDHGFPLMAWTLDAARLEKNPLMSKAGRASIQSLMDRYGLKVRSLTGDCFMQSPFWKVAGPERIHLLETFKTILVAAAAMGIQWIVVPLVDNGRLESKAQTENLLEGLGAIQPLLAAHHQQIVFESDLSPANLHAFITQLDARFFGLNYNTGHSAALGYDPEIEIKTYGDRIYHVHIQDCLLAGTTVPLGKGNANFPAIFHALNEIHYSGQYILQTARALDGDHLGALCRYRDCVRQWLAPSVP